MQAIRRDAPQPTFAAPFPHGLPLDLVTAVRRHGAALPAATRAAVVGDCGRVLTWEQLVASATRGAAALSCRAGVGRGESAALLSRNCVQVRTPARAASRWLRGRSPRARVGPRTRVACMSRRNAPQALTPVCPAIQ